MNLTFQQYHLKHPNANYQCFNFFILSYAQWTHDWHGWCTSAQKTLEILFPNQRNRNKSLVVNLLVILVPFQGV